MEFPSGCSGRPLGEDELAVIAEIHGLRQTLRQRTFEPRRWSGSLRRVQLARGVQASNSIEGDDAEPHDTLAIERADEIDVVIE